MLIRTKEEGERIARHLGQHRVHLLRVMDVTSLLRTSTARRFCCLPKGQCAVQWQIFVSGKNKIPLTEEAKHHGDSRLWRQPYRSDVEVLDGKG